MVLYAASPVAISQRQWLETGFASLKPRVWRDDINKFEHTVAWVKSTFNEYDKGSS